MPPVPLGESVSYKENHKNRAYFCWCGIKKVKASTNKREISPTAQ